jgi:hypothetical protein
VRVPHDFPLDEIQLRIYHDGEARFFPLKEDKKSAGGGDRWWRVKVEMMNPQNSYRFLLLSKRRPSWLTAAGIKEYEPNSNTDFVILASPAYPSLDIKECLLPNISGSICHIRQVPRTT